MRKSHIQKKSSTSSTENVGNLSSVSNSVVAAVKPNRKKEVVSLSAESPDKTITLISTRSSPRFSKAKPSQDFIELSPIAELGLIDDEDEDEGYATADDTQTDIANEVDCNNVDNLGDNNNTTSLVQAIQLANPYKEGGEVEVGKHARDGYELLYFNYYNPSINMWVTKKAERLILPKLPVQYKVSLTDIAALKVQYCKPESEYRDNATCYPEIITGEFQFCGCDQISCLSNSALSSHYCGFCGKRLMGWCLVEPAAWGVCRNCYLVEFQGKITTGNNNPIVLPINNKKKLPVNALVKPTGPLLQDVPIDIADDVQIVDTDIPNLPTTTAQPKRKQKTINDIDSDSDFVDEDIPASAIPSKRARPVSNFNSIDEGIVMFDCPAGIIVPPKLRKPFEVDEIANIADQTEKTIVGNLWCLCCNLAYDSVAKDDYSRNKETSKTPTSNTKTKDKAGSKPTTTGRDILTSDRCVNVLCLVYAFTNYPYIVLLIG